MTQIRIRHAIHLIRQPNPSNVCWAASVAMTVGHGASIASVRAAAEAAGVRIHANGSLPVNDIANARLLARTFRLQTADVRTAPVTLEMIIAWLRRGKFAMLGGFNYRNRRTALDHAVTFFGVRGDGTARQTYLRIADPQGGLFRDDWDNFENDTLADPHFVLHK
ncbi:MAG: hypothetical protein WD468_07955 [Pirellulales bacterium]